MWPFNKIKSAEYIELLEKVNKLSTNLASVEIDLQLYTKKLKASKGLTTSEEKKAQDLIDDGLDEIRKAAKH